VPATQEVSQSSHLALQRRDVFADAAITPAFAAKRGAGGGASNLADPLEHIASPVQDGLSRQPRLADLRCKKSDHHSLCRRPG